jgi:Bifunctional DNA primase/polymerase, N-terminal.
LATESEIKSWWSSNQNYNIGIITGKLSNLFVVDIDTEEGFKNINEYIPDSIVTPTASTPRGGQHLFFKYPIGNDITIGAGTIPGTDFRGEGGYVVGAPSVNGNGKAYEWVIPHLLTPHLRTYLYYILKK